MCAVIEGSGNGAVLRGIQCFIKDFSNMRGMSAGCFADLLVDVLCGTDFKWNFRCVGSGLVEAEGI